MNSHSNLAKIRNIFVEESARHGLKGVLGVAAFASVYGALLPVQQRLLGKLCGDKLKSLMEGGSVISLAYAYHEYAIDAIGVKEGDGFDKEAWNIYAREYHRLNDALDATAARLAQETGGVAIPATVEDIAREVRHVEEYYGMAVSHRVAAEEAGVGWRGKNELIVNPRYSCAIRLASVVTALPIERTTPSQGSCGVCRACLDACPFLKFKDSLDNYREQCRQYIISLDLDGEVCGKCVKACVNSPIFESNSQIDNGSSIESVYYT
jgi:epoxyqueuosine reductase QueG